MAVKVFIKPDRRYYQDREGIFRPIENLSITASTPTYPAVLHKTRRTMILADDRSHAVVALDRELVVSRNTELSAVLIAFHEPTAATGSADAAYGSRRFDGGARSGSEEQGFDRTEEKGRRSPVGMLARCRTLVGLAFVSALIGCATPPPPPPPPKPKVIGPRLIP